MSLHQTITIFNEYNRRFNVSDGDDDDTDEDESLDDDQDRLWPPTEVNQDIFDVMVMLGSILSSKQAMKKQKNKRKVQLDVRFPRRALPPPASSPWVHIYASNCNKSMICFTGLNYAAFNYLSVMFEELYNKYTHYSRSGFIVLKKRVSRYRRPRQSLNDLCNLYHEYDIPNILMIQKIYSDNL